MSRFIMSALAFGAFVLAGLAQVGLSLLAVAERTRAAPPEEFGPTALLLEYEPWLVAGRLGFALIAAALFAWLIRGRSRSLGLPAIELDPRPALVLRNLHLVIGLPSLGLLVAVATELSLFTWPHAGVLFSTETFARLSWLSAAGAVALGTVVGLEFLCALMLFITLVGPFRPWRVLGFSLGTFGLSLAAQPLALAVVCGGFLALGWLFQRGVDRMLALPLIVLAVAWVRTAGIAFEVLGSEIAALGLGSVVVGFFGLISSIVAAWSWAGIRRQLVPMPVGLRQWARIIATSVLSPVTAFVPRSWRPVTTALSGTAVVAGLLSLNYPNVLDFSQTMQPIWSTSLALVSAGIVIALWPAGPGRATRFAPVGAVLVSIVAWVLVANGSTNATRAVSAEYTRLTDAVLQFVEFTAVLPGEPVVFTPFMVPVLPADITTQNRRPLMMVLLWDAARADRTSLQGYPRRTTPHLDALARESVVFTNAASSATATSASLRHLFTGRHSSRYMLATDHAPFFTGALLANGYKRAAINILGTDYNGVSRAAFVRNQPSTASGIDQRTTEFGTYHEGPKVERILELVDAYVGESSDGSADGLFVFGHFPAPHYPWRQHEDTERFGEEPGDLYDSCLAHADAATGRLFAGLKARGLYQDAIIVVTSDHGTGLGEHGRHGGFHPYQEQIHVPLVIRVPGVSPRRVAEPVSGIDLAPTLLSMIAPNTPNLADGLSLTPLMSGRLKRLPRRWLFSHSAFEDALAVIDSETGYKLILHRKRGYALLFHLPSDPGELYDLSDAHCLDFKRMMSVALGYLEAGKGTWANPNHYSPSPVN